MGGAEGGAEAGGGDSGGRRSGRARRAEEDRERPLLPLVDSGAAPTPAFQIVPASRLPVTQLITWLLSFWVPKEPSPLLTQSGGSSDFSPRGDTRAA